MNAKSGKIWNLLTGVIIIILYILKIEAFLAILVLLGLVRNVLLEVSNSSEIWI